MTREPVSPENVKSVVIVMNGLWNIEIMHKRYIDPMEYLEPPEITIQYVEGWSP